MRLRKLLCLPALLYAGSTVAQVHGEGGYYNWTLERMKAAVEEKDISINYWGCGNKGSGDYADLDQFWCFTDRYLKSYLGVQSQDEKFEEYGGMQFRSGIYFQGKTDKEPFMTLTPEYPVLAFKVSVPMQSETIKDGNTVNMEVYWDDPYTEEVETTEITGMPGFNSGKKTLDVVRNSRPWEEKDEFGRDQAQLKYDILTGRNDAAAKSDTVILMKRMDKGYDRDSCDIFVAINFAAMKDKEAAEEEEAARLIDRLPIKIMKLTLGAFAYARGTVGDGTGQRVKTRYEMPYVYAKAIRTYRSMTEALEGFTDKNNYGDGPSEFALDIPEAGMCTYYGEQAFTLPKGVKAGVVTMADNATAQVDWRYAEGDMVPPLTGVLLSAADGVTSCRFLTSSVYLPSPEDNLLQGSLSSRQVVGGGYRYYKLAEGTNGLGFYYDAEGGESILSGAHKAYLALPEAMAANAHFISLDGGTTHVGCTFAEGEEIVDVVGVSGTFWKRRVRKVDALDGLPKGIYIVKGKKYVVK